MDCLLYLVEHNVWRMVDRYEKDGRFPQELQVLIDGLLGWEATNTVEIVVSSDKDCYKPINVHLPRVDALELQYAKGAASTRRLATPAPLLSLEPPSPELDMLDMPCLLYDAYRYEKDGNSVEHLDDMVPPCFALDYDVFTLIFDECCGHTEPSMWWRCLHLHVP